MPFRTPLPILLACTLSGCVTVPESLEGEFAHEPLPDATTEADQDQRVRWGGLLVATPRVGDDENCMEMFARPLDRWYRPDFRRPETGRFLACHDGQLDPEEFVPGRDVTVVGVFEGFVEGQVGDDVHRYPLVRVDSAHAWSLTAQFNNGPRQTQRSGQSQSGWANRQVDRQEKVRAVKSIKR